MKLNRKLVLILALLVSIAMATTGTLAYLSDTDADVNVMTLGNVYIVQNEQERTADGELVPFTQNKAAYPAVGPIAWATEGVDVNGTKYKVFTDELKNVIDKIVTVTNTGKSDAFVRTIVAIEAPKYDPKGLIHINYNGTDVTSSAPISFSDENVDYVALAFTYADALKAGQTSAPSLVQLFLDSKATNEDIAEFGDTWEIKVLSQAVQTAGFADAKTALDAAFGELSVTNVTEWFGGDLSIGSPSETIPLPEGWPNNNPPSLGGWQEEVDTSWHTDANATEYTIKTAEELAGLAKMVNEGETFKGKTVVLANDIDLGAHQWTPIGTSTNHFKGTFDGQNHTISNLTVLMPGKSNVGLFGMTTDGEIKNLTVKNATVTGRLNVGVVAGTPYTSKYTNIKVTGHVEVNGLAYVGGVGGKNAYANWTDITVNVDETSYVKAHSVENGSAYRTYVGGVVGFMGEGGHTFKNVTSNIDVSGSTCDVGGIVGIAHYGNNFVNCSSSGDVTIYAAAEAADTEEMGGIAGVWHNGGADVTFENCSFTGKLTANITEGVDLSDNTIVGEAYSASGSGNLIIK